MDWAERAVSDADSIAHWNGRDVVVVGPVVERDDRFNGSKVTVAAQAVNPSPGVSELDRMREPLADSVSGNALVTLPRGTEVGLEDILAVRCRFEEPGVINDFDYGAYLRMSNIYTVCYRPSEFRVVVSATERKLGVMGGVRRAFDFARGRFKETIDATIPYPASALLSAIVFGMRRELPEELLDEFSRTSVTHIIAVSGSHISVIMALVWTWLLGFGVRRSWAFWVTLIFILGFLGVIGFISSAVRAGIMGMLVLIARYLGRPRHTVNALVFAAAVMLALQPLLGRFDVGFQLSFLAVLGIVYLEPYFRQLFDFLHVPELGFLQMKSTLTISLAAQVFVLPWALYHFHILSLIGPFANIVVLPIANLALLSGIALVGAGMISSQLAAFAGWWANVVLQAFLGATHFFARISWGSVRIDRMSLLIALGMYVGMAGLLWYAHRRSHIRQKNFFAAPVASEEIEVVTISLDGRVLK